MTDDPNLLGDRYQLGEVLGRGGMAEVRRARDTRLGRDVAVKTLRADLAGDSTFQARFRREAQSAAGLNHPTIVSVYDTGVKTDADAGVEIPYIVMELVEGHTLRDVLRDGRRILPERALELTQGVLDALSYSHRAGIIHRDIKPANVMLTKSGAVKVMDFGIARAVSDTAATMTQTAAVIGTAQYLSPEQARGETVDARSDIYSAGCLLYELLTGRPPFQGDSPVSVAYQHVRETPVAPSQVDGGDPEITPEMDAITLKALAKDPAERYQSAKEMRDDIGRLLAGTPVAASIPTDYVPKPVSQPTPTEEPTRLLTSAAPVPQRAYPMERIEPARRRSPAKIALLALIALALLGAVLYAIFAFIDPRGEATTSAPVNVPRVIGLQREAATSTLANNGGLRIEVEPVKGPEETKGQVIDQNPAAGTQVPAGSTVHVKLNTGPETKTIPKVKGKPLEEARKILSDAGFSVVAARPNPTDNPKAQANEVTDVQPGEGTQAQPDKEVVLLFDDGASTMPQLKGFTVQAARGQLDRLGFTSVVCAYDDGLPVPCDTVAARPLEVVQGATVGEEVPRNTALTLIVEADKPTPSAAPTSAATPTLPPSALPTASVPASPTSAPAAPATTPSKTPSAKTS